MTSRIRRGGDKGTRGQGDKGTRRRGEGRREREGDKISSSPCPLVSLRQSRIIKPINAGKIKTAEANGETLLDALENLIAARPQSAPAQAMIKPVLRTPR